MIFSEKLKFSAAQDLAQVAGTYVSTNVIDTGAPGKVYGAAANLSRNVGPGKDVPILVQVTETFTSGGAATLEIQLETADEVAFDTTNKIIARSRVYALADLVAGLKWGVTILPDDCKRFLRLKYVIGTATTTAGEITAGIVAAVPSHG